jgi:hypothetical protein
VKPDKIIHQHRMTIYNYDLRVKWHFENECVKISEINILFNQDHNLIKFISGKVFKLIIEDIENAEIKKK